MAPIFIGSVILASISAWCARNAFTSRSSKFSSALYFALIFIALFLLRWRQITWKHEFNPDESQMVAQAMRYLSHPVPWRDVDGGTGGPLDSLLLSVPIYFGAPATWALARITLVFLNFLTLYFIYRGLRCFSSRVDCQLALMPGVVFYSFVLDQEYTHYSSEAFPVVLLAAGVYLLAREWTAARTSRVRWLLFGAICGALPFTKLQTVPLAGFYAVIGFAVIVSKSVQNGVAGQTVWRKLAWFAGGILVIPALILVPVTLCGALRDFWTCYIQSNASYVGMEGSEEKFGNLLMVLTGRPDFAWFFKTAVIVTACLLAAASLLGREKPSGKFWLPLLFAFADSFLTLGCLWIAGKSYFHYALFLVPPLTLLTGLAFIKSKAWTGQTAVVLENAKRPSRALIAGFCIGLIMLQWHNTKYFYRKNVHLNELEVFYGTPDFSLVSQRINTMRQPGDTMAIWGWMSGYNLETGMPPATRDANIAYLVAPIPLNGCYRRNYMADLEQCHPPVFIDAMAGNTFQWPNWTNVPTHETFPELDQFIRTNYTLWSSIHMTNRFHIGSPIRIYVANARMAKLHLTAEELYTRYDPKLEYSQP